MLPGAAPDKPAPRTRHRLSIRSASHLLCVSRYVGSRSREPRRGPSVYPRTVKRLLVLSLCSLAACGTDAPDATGNDATPPGDSRDGPSSGGSSAAGCQGATVCEDFESTAVGSTPGTPWTISTPSCMGAGTLAVDSAQAHRGAHALKIAGKGNFCDHVFLSSAAPATMTGTLHARFYVRFETAFAAAHTTFLALADSTDAKDLRMGGQQGIFMFNRELNDATLPALSPAGIAQSLAPAAGTWYCVELAIDGAGHTLRASIDGVARAGLALDTTPTPDIDQQWLNGPVWSPRLQNIRFGWEAYGGPAMNLWFDDIAIGTAPIGCL